MSDEIIENLSFEEALTRLESLVRELEAGKIKLDDAVSAYEQAVILKKFCENKLNEAKLKIEKIETASNGNLSLTPLDKIENNE
ncbi:MAG: exodeoxyribonuclease VII small subunit [Alphaproteobacteria bacterium]|nr:exodeoxyribonuclease VII small subunit [Alphaproteobacteria bacterium]